MTAEPTCGLFPTTHSPRAGVGCLPRGCGRGARTCPQASGVASGDWPGLAYGTGGLTDGHDGPQGTWTPVSVAVVCRGFFKEQDVWGPGRYPAWKPTAAAKGAARGRALPPLRTDSSRNCSSCPSVVRAGTPVWSV